MPSNLFQQINNQNPTNKLISMYKSASNPQALLNDLMAQNPNYRKVMNMIQSSGKSPKELFYEKANELGVNPENILNQLR